MYGFHLISEKKEDVCGHTLSHNLLLLQNLTNIRTRTMYNEFKNIKKFHSVETQLFISFVLYS